MNTDDNDIVKIDFPPYVEEHSPFPDVEPDFNFEDNKEEIYLRNRIIAVQEQVKLLKEEERKRLEKQERLREMTQAAKTVNRTAKKKRLSKTRISVYWTAAAFLIAVCCTVALFAVISATYSRSSSNIYYDPDTSEIAVVIGDVVLRGGGAAEEEFTEMETTQVSREPIVTEISEEITEEEETEIILEKDPFSTYDEIRKTTAVREPFEAAEGETVAIVE